MLQTVQLSVRLLQQIGKWEHDAQMADPTPEPTEEVIEGFNGLGDLGAVDGEISGVVKPTLLEYISENQDRVISAFIAQIELVIVVVSIISLIAIVTGLLIWKNSTLVEVVTSFWSIVFTIPSLAMFIFFIGPFGLGWKPAVIALVLYGQLPVVRNTIVGLRSIEPAILESAMAMGMKPMTVLRKVHFPLAWPIIIVGIRVSCMLTFGISAIAAYVGGPGLGDLLFSGLAQLGSFNAMNQTLVGALGITILALIFDAFFVVIRRVTTPRGLRV